MSRMLLFLLAGGLMGTALYGVLIAAGARRFGVGNQSHLLQPKTTFTLNESSPFTGGAVILKEEFQNLTERSNWEDTPSTATHQEVQTDEQPNKKTQIRFTHLANSPPIGFNDVYCPYNEIRGEQCGGGPIERIRHTQCRANVTVSYYEDCNYGNAPNILDPLGSLHPQDPEPACTTDNTQACDCDEVDTPPCGVVLRLFPHGCLLGCCPPLPVSCEQCCGGSAWLYDTVTGGCACGEP